MCKGADMSEEADTDDRARALTSKGAHEGVDHVLLARENAVAHFHVLDVGQGVHVLQARLHDARHAAAAVAT